MVSHLMRLIFPEILPLTLGRELLLPKSDEEMSIQWQEEQNL